MKKVLSLGLVIGILGFLLAGCTDVTGDSDTKQQQQQEKILKEATAQAGMPNITHFFERKMMKEIIELRDNPSLTTYVYTQNMDGKFVYLGRAIGFGLPYSTQYTNPEKASEHSDTGGGNYTLPQADPNGLFSPASTDATWIMLVNEETNEPEIVYSEPHIIVTQSKLDKRLCEEWSLPKSY